MPSPVTTTLRLRQLTASEATVLHDAAGSVSRHASPFFLNSGPVALTALSSTSAALSLVRSRRSGPSDARATDSPTPTRAKRIRPHSPPDAKPDRPARTEQTRPPAVHLRSANTRVPSRPSAFSCPRGRLARATMAALRPCLPRCRRGRLAGRQGLARPRPVAPRHRCLALGGPSSLRTAASAPVRGGAAGSGGSGGFHHRDRQPRLRADPEHRLAAPPAPSSRAGACGAALPYPGDSGERRRSSSPPSISAAAAGEPGRWPRSCSRARRPRRGQGSATSRRRRSAGPAPPPLVGAGRRSSSDHERLELRSPLLVADSGAGSGDVAPLRGSFGSALEEVQVRRRWPWIRSISSPGRAGRSPSATSSPGCRSPSESAVWPRSWSRVRLLPAVAGSATLPRSALPTTPLSISFAPTGPTRSPSSSCAATCHYLFSRRRACVPRLPGRETRPARRRRSGRAAGCACLALLRETLRLRRGARARVAAIGASGALLPLWREAGLRALYLGDEAILETRASRSRGARSARCGSRSAESRRPATQQSSSSSRRSTTRRSTELEHVSRRWRAGRPERGFSMAMDSLDGEHQDESVVVVARDGSGRVIAASCTSSPSTAGRRCPSRSCAVIATTPNGLTEYLVVKAVELLRERGIGRALAQLRRVRPPARSTGRPHGALTRRRSSSLGEPLLPDREPLSLQREILAALGAAIPRLRACPRATEGRLRGDDSRGAGAPSR